MRQIDALNEEKAYEHKTQSHYVKKINFSRTYIRNFSDSSMPHRLNASFGSGKNSLARKNQA